MPFAKILNAPNAASKKAIEDARTRKTHKTKSLELLFSNLNK
jgi:hypothetical protein